MHQNPQVRPKWLPTRLPIEINKQQQQQKETHNHITAAARRKKSSFSFFFFFVPLWQVKPSPPENVSWPRDKAEVLIMHRKVSKDKVVHAEELRRGSRRRDNRCLARGRSDSSRRGSGRTFKSHHAHDSHWRGLEEFDGVDSKMANET